MRKIKVGIAYEGGEDGEIIASILRRIIAEKDLTFDDFEVESPGTAIVEMSGLYARKFVSNNIELAIFCTDHDKASENRENEIKNKIRAVDELLLQKTAIGIPNPHLEAWLLADEGTIKRKFDLDGSKPLPYPEMTPKDRLTRFYSESKIDDRLESDVRIEIARELDLRIAAQRDGTLRRFIDQVRSAINSI